MWKKFIINKFHLSKIANKSRVKLTVAEYKERAKKVTKAGNPMSKMAHMELVLKENLKS